MLQPCGLLFNHSTTTPLQIHFEVGVWGVGLGKDWILLLFWPLNQEISNDGVYYYCVLQA